MNQNGIMCANGNNLMAFDPAASVEEQDNECFHVRVEIRVVEQVQAEIIGGFLWGVAQGQLFWRRAFTQRHDLEFMRLRGKAEGLDQLTEARQRGSLSSGLFFYCHRSLES